MTATDTTEIRLLLVDDSELVRRGTRTLLEGEHKGYTIKVAGEAANVSQAMALIAKNEYDVVLLDIRLPDGTGFEICREIVETRPHSRVLMLTSFSNDNFVHEAIISGAHGYLMKEIDPDQLVDSIIKLHRGEYVLGPGLTERVVDIVRHGKDRGSKTSSGLKLLSPQENKVLALVAQGRTNKEIGVMLNLSDNTVKNYLVNVFEKLGVKRRAQATALYVQEQNAMREATER